MTQPWGNQQWGQQPGPQSGNPWQRPMSINPPQGGQQQWGAPTGAPHGQAPAFGQGYFNQYQQRPGQWGQPQGQPWPQQPSQPQWGQRTVPPQPGQMPWGQPKRKNPFLTLLKAILILGALAFVGLVLLGFLLVKASESIEVPAPSEPPAPYPTARQSQPSEEPTWASSDEPSSQPSATTRPTRGPSEAYENDDYQVPPVDRNPPGIPSPETYDEATELLKRNPLYATSVPNPVRCEMATIDVANASTKELETHFNDMMGCLMRVWEGPLDESGFEVVRPRVTVYSQSIQTKCGKLPMRNAVYCGADQNVYYAKNLYTVVPPQLQGSRYITEAIVAHEFGHAVQARSGILISEAAWAEKSSKATALELSRRLEVQADCLAGLFLNSIAQSTEMTEQELANVPTLFYGFGDDVASGKANYVGNHGSGRNRQAWAAKGLANQQVGTCNAFTAPASQVR